MAKHILKTARKPVNENKREPRFRIGGPEKVGARFGRLEIIGIVRPGRYLTRCDCGAELELMRCQFVTGRWKSCGCAAREWWKAFGRSGTHHATNTSEYHSWTAMKQRCLNPNSKKFPDYGGRGITICQQWIDSFEQFDADMGRKPSRGYTIERRNVNGPYAPWNCCWLPRSKQTVNRRNTRWITWDGVQRPLEHWCRELGLTRTAIERRAKRFQISLQEAFERYMAETGRALARKAA